MPHLIVEYTKNIHHDAGKLLRELTIALSNCDPSFPIAAIRARAIELQSFYMADGADYYAFVHIELRIAPGRASDTKKRARAALLDTAKYHLFGPCASGPLALSVELTEAAEKADKYSNFLVNGMAP